jgi:hypothetical protein
MPPPKRATAGATPYAPSVPTAAIHSAMHSDSRRRNAASAPMVHGCRVLAGCRALTRFASSMDGDVAVPGRVRDRLPHPVVSPVPPSLLTPLLRLPRMQPLTERRAQAYTWQLSCAWKPHMVEARALRAIALPQVRSSSSHRLGPRSSRPCNALHAVVAALRVTDCVVPAWFAPQSETCRTLDLPTRLGSGLGGV